MTTQKQVRAAFWNAHPQLKPEYRAKKRQDDYKCDTRMAFIDYVESLRKDGVISEELAYRITL